MIEVLGVKNADKLVPTKEDAKPKDPVSENMDALTGEPMKAFMYQDHQAHIATHMSFLQDPMIAQMIAQNPQAKQIGASMQAHIAEHLGFQYRSQIEEKLGVALPRPNEELPEEIEVELSKLVADAGRQLTQQHQQQAAQQAAQQKAQDPIIQMQQKELQIKEQEVQRKIAKDQADVQIRQQQAQTATARDMSKAMIEAERLKLERAELAIEAEEKGANIDRAMKDAADKKGIELIKLSKEKNN
jgi:hypothetical protein